MKCGYLDTTHILVAACFLGYDVSLAFSIDTVPGLDLAPHTDLNNL